MVEHRRRADANGNSVHERATDSDAWARLDAWATRYKIAWAFWVVLLSVGGWIGSKVIRPLDQVPVIAARQTAILDRLDKGDSDRSDMQDILGILVRIQCLALDPIDRVKVGIDCGSIPLPAVQGSR